MEEGKEGRETTTPIIMIMIGQRMVVELKLLCVQVFHPAAWRDYSVLPPLPEPHSRHRDDGFFIMQARIELKLYKRTTN